MKKTSYLHCVIIIFIIFFLSFSVNQQTVSASEINVETYGDSDYILDNEYTICDYPQLIGTRGSLSYQEDELIPLNLGQNDLIVEIIPEDLFYTIGSHAVMGDEYGFYINTSNLSTNVMQSTVLVYDIYINTNLIETVDKIILSITPIFEYKFLCITGTCLLNVNEKIADLTVDSPWIIPYPTFKSTGVEYDMTTDFYLKDISYGLSVFNEQAANYGDDNYDASVDDGLFFINYDFSYNGNYVQYGDITLGDLGWFVTDLVDFGVSFFETSTLADVLGKFYNGASLLIDFYDIFIEGGFCGEIVRQSRSLTATGYYTTRNEQVQNYFDSDGNPYLTKAVVMYCDTSEDQSMWYGIGDDLTGYFTLSHSADVGEPIPLTRLTSDCSLEIVNSNTGEVVSSISNVRYDSLGDITKENLEIETTKPITLLPQGINYFEFNPTISSDYLIDIYTSSNVLIEIGGEMYPSNGAFSIQRYCESNENIDIKISGDDCWISGNISITPNASPGIINVEDADNYLLKISNEGFKKIKFSNSNCELLIFNNLDDEAISVGKSEIGFLFNPNTDYYLIIRNNSETSISGNLIIEDYTNELDVGISTMNIGQGESYYSFVVEESCAYRFTVVSSSNEYYYFSIYSDNAVQTFSQFISSNGNYYDSYFLEDCVYYIGFKNPNNVMGSITINVEKNEMVFDWYINGCLLTGNDLYIEQGKEFTVEVRYGGECANLVFAPTLMNNATTLVDTLQQSNKFKVKDDASIAYDPDKKIIATEYNFKIQDYIVVRIVPIFELDIQKDITGSVVLENNYKWSFSSSNINDKVKIEGKINWSDGTSTIFLTDKSTSGVIELPSAKLVRTVTFGNLEVNKLYYYPDGADQNVITFINNLDVDEKYNCYTISIEDIKMNTLFAGGTGTISDPYQIYNYWHFENIRKLAQSMRYDDTMYENAINSNFVLKNSISYPATFTYVPLPSFWGTLTSDHIIRRINIWKINTGTGVTRGNCGLFSILRNAEITDIEVTIKMEVNTSSSSNSTLNKGGICGRMYGGRIDNCDTYGQFNGSDYTFIGSNVGGIVGSMSSGEITNCKSYMSLYAYGNIGGIVGSQFNGIIQDCLYGGMIWLYYVEGSNSNVDSNPCVGGIVGIAYAGTAIIDAVVESQREDMIVIKYGSNQCKDEYLKPCLGLVIGRKVSSSTTMSATVNSSVISSDNLIVFTTGTLWWKETHDQTEYVSSTQYVGRIG